MKHILMLIITVATLVGCQSSTFIQGKEVYSVVLSTKLPESVYRALTATSGTSSVPTVYVAYKSFLTPSEGIHETPFSYIHFPKPPTTPKLKNQYSRICELYVSMFSDKADVDRYLDHKSEKTIPVFWFVRKDSKETDCQTFVNTYDYERARSLYPKKSYQSPSLVAHFGDYIIRMDLKQLSNPDELDKAFTVWRDHITKYPSSSSELDVVTILFSAKKVLGVFSDILSLSKS